MRKSLFAALTCIAVLLAFSGTPALSATEGPVVIDPVSFTMDDGTRIEGTVFLPAAADNPLPLIVLIHGWGGNRHTFGFDDFGREMAGKGFVVLTYDVRGFGNSGGSAAVAGPREIKDLHLLMRLMLENRTSLGGSEPIYPDRYTIHPQAIGVTGVSYGGGHSYLSANANYDPNTYLLPAGVTPEMVDHPQEFLKDPVKYPKVRAIAPIVGWTDLYQSLFPNDVLKYSYDAALTASATGDADAQIYQWLLEAVTPTGDKERLRQVMKERSLLFGGEWVKPEPENSILQVPTFMIQAWEDYLFPGEEAINLYRRMTDKNPHVKLYLGNTGHPPASITVNTPETRYLFEQISDWFAYWLKGDKTKKSILTTRVEAAPINPVEGVPWGEQTHKWKSLPETVDQTLYLHRGGGLTGTTPAAGAFPATLINQPLQGLPTDPILGEVAVSPSKELLWAIRDDGRFAQETIQSETDLSVGAAIYKTEPLAEPVTVFGQPQASLYATSSTSDLQLSVKVYDIDEQGRGVMTTRGMIYRKVPPLTPTRIDVDLFADHHTFPAGHRILVEIAPGDFPFNWPHSEALTMQLHQQQILPSSVRFPVLSTGR